MRGIFDIDNDGKLNFEEKLLALTVVMGILGEEERADALSDGFDDEFCDDEDDEDDDF